MKKKGFIWISAVLYIALGIVAISLVMTAGLPLINKMKERNTVLQTKDLMHTIDQNIWQVRSEGVGSRRVLQPVIIKGGKLMIFDDTGGDEGKNKIIWEMKTSVKLIEEGYQQKEGSLIMEAKETLVEGESYTRLILDYGEGGEQLKISLGEGYTSGSGLVGTYSLSLENVGGGAVKITVL